MMQKETEKQGLVLKFNLYRPEKELEVSLTHNREILDKLLREYAGEVDKIKNARYLHERIISSGKAKPQGFDATLKINLLPYQRKNGILQKAK